jgi:hypothetical protein
VKNITLKVPKKGLKMMFEPNIEVVTYFSGSADEMMRTLSLALPASPPNTGGK